MDNRTVSRDRGSSYWHGCGLDSVRGRARCYGGAVMSTREDTKKRLKSYMGAHNLTQKEMAELVGREVTVNQIHHLVTDGKIVDSAVEAIDEWLNKGSIIQMPPEKAAEKDLPETTYVEDPIGKALHDMAVKKNPQGTVALEPDVRKAVVEISQRLDKTQKWVTSTLIREALVNRGWNNAK